MRKRVKLCTRHRDLFPIHFPQYCPVCVFNADRKAESERGKSNVGKGKALTNQ